MMELVGAYDTLYERVLKEQCKSVAGLEDLDLWRHQFPVELAKRYENGEEISLSHDELKKLMKWKLKKGKFRPTLQKLINENDPKSVSSVTKEAFKLVLDSVKDLDEDTYVKLIKTSLTILVKLRGVGPATASLILSLLNKITKIAPPFFSDEAAYYIFKSHDKLKYSMSEYIKFLRLFYQLNDKFEYDFTQLEGGAWALELKDLYNVKEKKPNLLDEQIKPNKRQKKE